MPLRTPLDNGDQVEILVSKAQHPQPGWLSFVVTGKARAKVRRFVKSKEREERISLGRKIYDEIVQRLPTPPGWEAMAEALKRLHLHDDERRPHLPCERLGAGSGFDAPREQKRHRGRARFELDAELQPVGAERKARLRRGASQRSATPPERCGRDTGLLRKKLCAAGFR